MWNQCKPRSLERGLLCCTLVLSAGAAPGAAPVVIQEAETFIGTDPGLGSGTALTLSGGVSEPILQLATGSIGKPGGAGTHVLNIRFKDDMGVWSNPVKIGFPVYAAPVPSSNNVKAMEAYLDGDPGLGSGQAFTGVDDDSLVERTPVTSFDISGLGAGGHTVSVRARDSQDQWSAPVTIGFPIYQPPVTSVNQIAVMEGFIGYPPPAAGDGTPFSGVFDDVIERTTGHVSILNQPQGIFPYGARVRDTSGEWSGVVTMVFEYFDSDGDGIPDAYEDAHNMDKNDPTDAESDVDSDKFTALDEYLFDTDPEIFLDRPVGDPGCSSGLDDIVLNSDFHPGLHICIGTASIRTGSPVKILDGAYLYLRAPAVGLNQQARVEEGARVRIRTVDLTP